LKKTWILLIENYNYSATTIFNISFLINTEIKENEIRMIYNRDFLNWYEEFLINNGIIFELIIYKDDYIGIIIKNTEVNLTPIFTDCMTLSEFSKNREYLKTLEI